MRLLSSATFAMAALTLSGVVVFAPAFFRIWLDEPLPTAVVSARLFTIAIALNLLAAPLAYRALAEGRHRLTAIASMSNIAVNAVASYALTLLVGFKGPLYGSILGNACGTIVFMVLMAPHVELRELFHSWRAVAVGVIATGVALLVGAGTVDSWVALGAAVAVFAGIVGPILVWVEHVPVRALLRRDLEIIG